MQAAGRPRKAKLGAEPTENRSSNVDVLTSFGEAAPETVVAGPKSCVQTRNKKRQ